MSRVIKHVKCSFKNFFAIWNIENLLILLGEKLNSAFFKDSVNSSQIIIFIIWKILLICQCILKTSIIVLQNVNSRGISVIFIERSVMFAENRESNCTEISVEFYRNFMLSLFKLINSVNVTDLFFTVYRCNLEYFKFLFFYN